jgi:hypothetical protein
MMTRPERGTDRRPGAAEPDGRAALVGGLVLQMVGGPSALLRASARHLGGDFYRVDVVTGEGGASAETARCYVVRTDADGRVLTTDPPIAPRGAPAGPGPRVR